MIQWIESSCLLSDPHPINPNKTLFLQWCSAEGDTYTEPILLERISTGVIFTKENYSFEWDNCKH